MPKQDRENYTEEDIHASWVDQAPQLNSTVTLVDYDPRWPELYDREAARIRGVLGDRVVQLEHVGSTSVPGLCAKPIVDILLIVPDSSDEPTYLPDLENAGYRLVIREPDWEAHRAFKGPDTNINLHVYSTSTKEIERYLLFRDRLRAHDSERELYAATKRELAQRTWKYIQHYADAKTAVIDEILGRARAAEQAAPYDEFSEAYANHAADNPYQALYDRPAILKLAGPVVGKRVLDVGCAAGHLSAKLAERGAAVTGIDLSQGMVDLARQRHGNHATFEQADLAEPLTFVEDESIDLITASLVLHYLLDWDPTLGEFRRVLRHGGALVMSVHHPDDWRWFDRPNYFRTERVTDEFPIGGRLQPVQFYRRPLSKTFGALRQAGFTVDEIAEPMPLPEAEHLAPVAYESLITKPRFLYFRAIK
ncbi:MAG: hypothetical protein QOI21_3905 [Actinomycetota bacterium]|jgi:GrpB-like predicted nucleotidyltransferase (UPF0157 family)/SAM-dependent methyltransferase|nr:hypothetical protein [Actinomycetota bacterium]